MLREVAVSMVERRGRWILWLMRWQGEMDSATARGMTKFGFDGYSGNDAAVMLREVAVSMVGRKGRGILWLMRWQGEMDSATARGMTKFDALAGGRWIPRLRAE